MHRFQVTPHFSNESRAVAHPETQLAFVKPSGDFITPACRFDLENLVDIRCTQETKSERARRWIKVRRGTFLNYREEGADPDPYFPQQVEAKRRNSFQIVFKPKHWVAHGLGSVPNSSVVDVHRLDTCTSC